MEIALSLVAREHVRELAAHRMFNSPEAVVEAAIWGVDGPACDLSDREWDTALDREPWWARSGPGISGDEFAIRMRAYIEERKMVLDEWARYDAVPTHVHLSEAACRHIDVFVKSGVYVSREAAVEAALLTAVELAPPGTDGAQITNWFADERPF